MDDRERGSGRPAHYVSDMADKILDNAIAHAGRELLDEECAQCRESGRTLCVPQALDERVFAMIENAKERERKAAQQAKRRRLLRSAAAVLLCVTVVGSVSIASVDAWRVRFQNLFIGKTDETTDFKYMLDDTNNIIPSGIPLPEYIPDGFQAVASGEEGERSHIVFQNEAANKTLIYELSQSEVTFFQENVQDMVSTDVNGEEGHYIKKNEVHSLIWEHEQYVCALRGNLDQTELTKVAESILY